jgi:hypothetical protein
MYGDSQSGMQCVECEALLADALDGTLQGAALAAFESHEQGCPACHAMRQEASLGLHWLKRLEECEPPKNLVHNILAQTIGTLPSEQVEARPCETFLDKVKQRLSGFFGPVATPRFAMSFGMAFFSITMLLNVAGFHLTDLRHIDLTSKGVVKMYYDTEARVVRYYENIRLVYEIESRVRDLRKAVDEQQEDKTPTNQPSKEEPKQDQKQEQNRKYQHHSLEKSPFQLAQDQASRWRVNQARLNRSES